jgi:hypothetical protein
MNESLFLQTKIEKLEKSDISKRIIIYLAEMVNIECSGVHLLQEVCGKTKLGYLVQNAITSQHATRIRQTNPLSVIYW